MCSDEDANEELYKSFLDNYKGNAEQQKFAYEAGKDYIDKYERCQQENDKRIIDYLRKWMTRYEAAVKEWERWRSRQP